MGLFGARSIFFYTKSKQRCLVYTNLLKVNFDILTYIHPSQAHSIIWTRLERREKSDLSLNAELWYGLGLDPGPATPGADALPHRCRVTKVCTESWFSYITGGKNNDSIKWQRIWSQNQSFCYYICCFLFFFKLNHYPKVVCTK